MSTRIRSRILARLIVLVVSTTFLSVFGVESSAGNKTSISPEIQGKPAGTVAEQNKVTHTVDIPQTEAKPPLTDSKTLLNEAPSSEPKDQVWRQVTETVQEVDKLLTADLAAVLAALAIAAAAFMFTLPTGLVWRVRHWEKEIDRLGRRINAHDLTDEEKVKYKRDLEVAIANKRELDTSLTSLKATDKFWWAAVFFLAATIVILLCDVLLDPKLIHVGVWAYYLEVVLGLILIAMAFVCFFTGVLKVKNFVNEKINSIVGRDDIKD